LRFLLLLAGIIKLALTRKVVRILFCLLIVLAAKVNPGFAQYKIMGTVYDSSRNYPLELVSVMSTSGKGTVTNSAGQYQIEVGEKDSIWFSYLNKPTVKFPVLKILTPFTFDIALQVNVPELREVRIKPRNYKEDSARNREEYAKVFNYQKPGLHAVTPSYGQAAGFDLNEIINVFRFRRNRNMVSFQQRLLMQEQEKFIDHRFSKALVRRLTGLDGNELDSFMIVYRPPYFFVVGTGDYDFQKYIKDSYERFRRGLPPAPILRDDESEEN
jgi:hypothetical protein